LTTIEARRNTRQIHLGDIPIGGGAPVVVQSMTNTDTRDWQATVNQIKRLEEVGCEIVRVAVPDHEAAEQLSHIKKAIGLPLIADIHFDYRLALEALQAGVDGLRPPAQRDTGIRPQPESKALRSHRPAHDPVTS